MWHMGDGWGWWMLINWIWFIALILLIFWAVRAIMAPGRSDDLPPRERTETDALEILNRRYASGEITEEQYERMRRRILDRPDTTPPDPSRRA